MNEFFTSDIILDFSEIEEKKRIIVDLQIQSPSTIYVSCSEHVLVSPLSLSAKNRDNMAGMTFFHPFNKLMPLVEIVRTRWTSDETIRSIYKWLVTIGKVPIVVKDTPGFLTTRLFAVCCVEAANMAFEGIPIPRIDSSLKKFGFALGPIQILDEIGLDVVLACLPTLTSTLGKRFSECESGLRDLIQHGYLGKKSKGLYVYDENVVKVNPLVLEMLEKSTECEKKCSDQDIIDRCVLLLINEASLCLMEGVVGYPEDIDLTIVYGLGFPAYRGGLLQYCDDLNRSNSLIPRLKELEMNYGSKFQPTQLLKNMNHLGRAFYPERTILHTKRSKM